MSMADHPEPADDLLGASGAPTAERDASLMASSTKSVSPWRRAARDFSHNKMGMIGLGIIVFMLLFAFLGPEIYRTQQIKTNIFAATLPPSARYPLGTDAVGYNVLGRLMVAGQSSLEVGFAAAGIAAIFGTLWGAIAAYVGGWVDSAMMRVVDSLLAIPSLLFVLLLASFITPSVATLILVLGSISWLITARLVRGQVLVLRTLEYIQAAEGLGQRTWQVVFRHLIRNVTGTVAVQATFEVANAILLLAALSFLGLGPAPPAANWGGMLTEGLNYLFDGYWWLIYPAGLCIVLTVVAFNLVGDAVRDAVELRLQRH
jgi:peptide/nickel transport system permease protein